MPESSQILVLETVLFAQGQTYQDGLRFIEDEISHSSLLQYLSLLPLFTGKVVTIEIVRAAFQQNHSDDINATLSELLGNST